MKVLKLKNLCHIAKYFCRLHTLNWYLRKRYFSNLFLFIQNARKIPYILKKNNDFLIGLKNDALSIVNIRTTEIVQGSGIQVLF